MTEHVEAAINEIIRVGVWSLRALDMKFAVADRAAPILAWAEAVEGGAIETLLTKTSQQLSGVSPAKWRSQITPHHWKFDAAGRSLLELGPIAADLLTLAARRGTVGRVDIVNAIDPVFLSGVIRIGAKRKIGIVAISSDDVLTLCGKPVSSIHSYPGANKPVFVEDSLPRNGEIDDAFAEWRQQRADTTIGTITLFSYLPRNDAPVPLRSSIQNDAEAKFANALSHGVSVLKSELESLYELEVVTWAPTSDRSRGQALF
jgi:hypothetical protein